MNFKLFGHVFSLRNLVDDLIVLLFAYMGNVGLNPEKYQAIFQQLGIQLLADFDKLKMLGGTALVIAFVKLLLNNTTKLAPIEVTPQPPSATGIKTGLFLLGFLLLASVSDAQTILRYQDFALNKEAVNGPIQGDFFSPMVLGGYTPFSIQNNVVTLNQNFTVDAAYAFSHATITPDGNGGVNLSPYWYAGAFVGGGIFSNGSADLGHGTFGLFAGKPDLMGPFAVALQDDLTNGNWSAGFVIVGTLDFLSGTSIIQVH